MRVLPLLACAGLPARMPSMIATVQRARDEFTMAMGREPSHDELASSVGISVSRLKVILSAAREPVSLDRELKRSFSDTRTLADTLPDNTQMSPSQRLEQRMTRQMLAKALNSILDPMEHMVICSCYDLIEDRSATSHPLSYEEIAVRFDKSAEWVAKVETRALKKLKGRPQLRNLLATRNVGEEYLREDSYPQDYQGSPPGRFTRERRQ